MFANAKSNNFQTRIQMRPEYKIFAFMIFCAVKLNAKKILN